MPCKDLDLQKRAVETNNYLKDLCGFCVFSFIENSNIAENYFHHDEIHPNKVGSFLLGQNFVSHFNIILFEMMIMFLLKVIYKLLSSANLSASNSNHTGVSDTQDINVFINDKNTLYNLSSFVVITHLHKMMTITSAIVVKY